MIHLEGELVPVRGDRTLVPGDQPGVIDKHVDPGTACPQLGGQAARLVQVGEVGDQVLRAAGSLDDGQRRDLLATKLEQIEDKRRQLGQMCEFLRAKLEDLEPTR